MPTHCPHCRAIFIVGDNPKTPPAERPARPAEVEAVGPMLGRIGRYEIRKIRGSGAHGVVYQAWDPELARWVALKVPQFSHDDEQRTRRFLTEAQAAARLRHPRIVAVYDSGSCLGRPYLASEFVDGQTLADRMEQRKIGRRDAVRIAYELAEALHTAHQAGIVHRDVKPANVMLDRQGHARLMDFGLAKRLDQDSGLTQDGTVLGTPAYLSPEQARGESSQIGPASDQYTLACVLFELLTGRKPFEGGTLAVVRRIASEPAPKLRSVDPAQDARLEAILERALNLTAEQRYPSIQQFGRELLLWWKSADGSGAMPALGTSSAPAPATKSAIPRTFTIGCSVVLAGLIVAGFAVSRFFTPPSQVVAPVNPPPQIPEVGVAHAAPQTPDSRTVAAPDDPPVIPAPVEAPVPQDQPPVNRPEAAIAVVPEPVKPAAPVTVKDPLEVLTTPESFPPLADDLAGPKQKQVVELLDAMLTRGLKSPNKESDARAADDAYAAAIALAPHEPRIAFARALILKKRVKPNDSLQQFEQARQLGGYPFVPAYQAVIQHKSATADYDGAADGLLMLAKDLAAASDGWPDESTRAKAYFWIGQMAGLHGVKGAIPASSSSRQSSPVFEKRTDELVAAVPPAFQAHYQAGYDEARRETNQALGNADDLEQANDQKLRDQAQAALEEAASKVAANEKRKVGIEQEAIERRKLIEERAANVRQQLESLKAQYQQLQVDAAPATQAYSEANQRMLQVQPPIPNADGTIDPAAQDNFVREQAAAASQLAEAARRLQVYSLRYEQIIRQAQTFTVQYAQLNLEFKRLTGETLAKIEQLSRDNKMEELKQKKVKSKAPRVIAQQNSVREAMKELREEYIQRDQGADAGWIRKSLPSASAGDQ